MSADEQAGGSRAGRPSLMDAIRSRPFLMGFFGWFAVNGPAWWLLTTGPLSRISEGSLILAFLGWFSLNLLLPLVLLVIPRTRRIAGGLFAAFAVNFLVSLALGLFQQAVCFVPFFIKNW